MISWVCGLTRSGNKLMILGRELVDVDGDGALDIGVDVLRGALNEPGVEGVTIPPTRRQKMARFEGSAKRQDGNPRVEAFKLRCRALKRQKNEERFQEFKDKCHAYKRQKMAEDLEDDTLVIARMVSATNNEVMRQAGLQTAIRRRHVGEQIGTMRVA